MELPPAGAVHDEREIEAVAAVMRDNPKLEIGAATLALEERVGAKLSKRFGLMVNSGSSALRIAIDLLGLEPGDEIITSPLTFSTDIAPMVQSGLVPVFVDIATDTYQIDADAVEDMIGANWRRLDDFMAGRVGVTPGRTTPDTDTTWMRFCFEITPDAGFDRTQAQEFLAARGVSTRMVWTGNILRQPGFAAIEHRAPAGGLPNCDRVMDHSLSLPIHHGLGPEHMDYICEQLDALFDRYS